MKQIFTAFFFFLKISLFAQGYIVTDGVKYLGCTSPGYGISVSRNPTNSSITTGFSLDPRGVSPPDGDYTNLFRFDPIVDVGVRVFFVDANQTITTNLLLSGALTELKFSFTSNYTLNSGTPFYLAFYTGNVNFAPPNGIYNNPMFGWVELVNNQGVIQMLDSAMEYGGAGIIAGTQNIIPVPEPNQFVLVTLGVLLVCWHSHKKPNRARTGRLDKRVLMCNHKLSAQRVDDNLIKSFRRAWRDGRDIALRCPRPQRSAGRNERGKPHVSAICSVA